MKTPSSEIKLKLKLKMNIRLEEGEALVAAAAYFNQEFQENIKRR